MGKAAGGRSSFWRLLESGAMDDSEDGAIAAQVWLARLLGARRVETAPLGNAFPTALAALAAEAMVRQRRLLVVTRDDQWLAAISNAVDLNLRPLCLVLPAAEPACRIALRATLSLLKSRLTRAGGDAEDPVWTARREHMANLAPLWRNCLDWSQRDVDAEAWPGGLDTLFPVCIMPMSLALGMAMAPDWLVLVEADRLPAPLTGIEGAWPTAARILRLSAGEAEARQTPDARLIPAQAERTRQAELEILTQELSELELELATAQAEVAGFTRRYQTMIGARMSTLDTLRATLATRVAARDPDNPAARREADAATAHARQTCEENERLARFDLPDGLSADARPFAPTNDLKRLYRRLAQKIHPDRASDDNDRAWRHQLMAEANRAYRAGDEAALREILALWREGSPNNAAAPPDHDGFAAALARLKRRIAEIERELNKLFGSKLYELFTACNIARRVGRDLLEEMATRLDADIAGVRAQLATRPPS